MTVSPELDVVQQWFQTVIMHPSGVDEGIASDEAQRMVYLRRDELEKVIQRSKNLSAQERLSIYANAYYARLLECLGECFPVLKRAVGDEVFNEFAFGYLQKHPSRSYTLNKLGDHFAQYLDQTRPDREGDTTNPTVNWPDFLIDLANLEWTISQVFDGPGVEKIELLSPEQWRSILPDDWPDTRLVPVVCLKLLHFQYPVNSYYTAVRQAKDDGQVPIPGPAGEWIAITRCDYVVRRHELRLPQYRLLNALQAGRTVGQAIAEAAEATDLDDDQLAESLRRWFTTWTAGQFFQAVDPCPRHPSRPVAGRAQRRRVR